MKIELIDQVYRKTDGWYWLDETHDEYGPYKSQSLAVNMLRRYIRLLDAPKRDKNFID